MVKSRGRRLGPIYLKMAEQGETVGASVMPALEGWSILRTFLAYYIAGLHPRPLKERVSSDFPRSPVSLTRSRGPWVPSKAPHQRPDRHLKILGYFPDRLGKRHKLAQAYG